MLTRAVPPRGAPLAFTVDGHAYVAHAGDTVLVAMLLSVGFARLGEFDGAPRAGFCWMGACQDCWVALEDGRRLRACTTPLAAGMRFCTRPVLADG